MLRTYKYRVYPSKAQLVRLASWEGALRWLWNLALEQRLIGLARPKGYRKYYTYFDQSADVTGLRKEVPWLNDVPRHACSQVLKTLDAAWQRCFRKVSGRPKFKKRSRCVSITEPDNTRFKLHEYKFHFPKIGVLPIIIDRPFVGEQRTCTLKRDIDQWFVHIVCEISTVTSPSRTEPIVAIDRGVTNVVADSDGQVISSPLYYEKARKQLARAQRTLARKQRGSNNRKKQGVRVAKIHRKTRRQREHFLHTLSYRYAKSHGTVVLEDLQVQNMIRVGGGLSRNMADQGWGIFECFLRYKLEASGGTLVKVPAQYSSQTCFACKSIDKASRNGESFVCTACGHSDHADINAAKVLKTRASRSCQLVEGSPVGSLRSKKSAAKPFQYRKDTAAGNVTK